MGLLLSKCVGRRAEDANSIHEILHKAEHEHLACKEMGSNSYKVERPVVDGHRDIVASSSKMVDGEAHAHQTGAGDLYATLSLVGSLKDEGPGAGETVSDADRGPDEVCAFACVCI